MTKAKAKKSSVKKSAAKKTNGSNTAAKAKAPGVIATIIATINRERGATADELVEILSKKFPDRQPDSMRRTVGIQASQNAVKKTRDDKRGLVYFGSK